CRRQRQRRQRGDQLNRGLARDAVHQPAEASSVEEAATVGSSTPGTRAGTRTRTRTPPSVRIAASPRSGPGRALRAAALASPPTCSALAPARAATPADQIAQPAATACPARTRQTVRAGRTATKSTDA